MHVQPLLEKYVSKASEDGEGVLFEGTNEILLSQLVLDLFSMHRNLSGQFSPPHHSPSPVQAPPPLVILPPRQPISLSLIKEQVSGATR